MCASPCLKTNLLLFSTFPVMFFKTNFRNSIETMSDYDNTNDFGGESAVGSGISGYNIDDFDILDSDPEEKLAIDAPMEAL